MRGRRSTGAAHRGWLLGALAVVSVLLAPTAAAATAPPALPELPIPVKVLFTATGDFTYDNSEFTVAHADDLLTWTVEYQSLLQPDGTLMQAATTPEPTAGNYTFTDSFYGVNCSGAISTVPRPVPPGTPNPPPAVAPNPTAEGLLIQSVTYLSTDPSYFSSCIGSLLGYEGEGEAAAGVAEVLGKYLPGALTARITPVPRQLLLAGGAALHVEPVSSSNAPEQVPWTCAELFGIQDQAKCTDSLSWNGTVVLDATAGCPLIVAGPPLACLPPSGTPMSSFTGGLETDASGPGTASLSASASGASGAHAGAARTVVIATATAKTRHAGLLRLKPRITPAGRRLLKRSRHLKVAVRIVFQPRSGQRATTRFSTVLTGR